MSEAERKTRPALREVLVLNRRIDSLVNVVLNKLLGNINIDEPPLIESTVVLTIDKKKDDINDATINGTITLSPGISCTDLFVRIPQKGTVHATRYRFRNIEEEEYWKVKNSISFTPIRGDTVTGEQAFRSARQALKV